MSPYRSTPTRHPSHVLYLGAPRLAVLGLVASVLCVAPLVWWSAERALAFWPLAFAAAAFALSALAFVTHHRAWIVLVPNEGRVRIVRLHAWNYSATTLRLSDAMSVECAPIGNTMWLFVVAQDGRSARVLPAASPRLVDEVETFIKSSGARPGTPSPR